MECSTPNCKKERSKKSPLCPSCKVARYKERYPVRYAFQVFRRNAKRRGKDFDLTYEQFEKFCYEVDLLHKRGRTSTAYHIDRIDDNRGYTIDNIQVLTNAENIAKEHRRRKMVCFDRQSKLGFMQEIQLVPLHQDLPF